MNSISLIRSILGPVRGSSLPLAYAVDITAQRMFQEHIAEDDLKLCGDICHAVSKRLQGRPDPKSVARSVARGANRCWEKLVQDGLAERYIGKAVSGIDSPRMMVIYLATFAQFDKPYFEVVMEHPEVFMGQLEPEPPSP